MVEGPPVSYKDKLKKYLPKEEVNQKRLAAAIIVISNILFYALTHDEMFTIGLAAVETLGAHSHFRNRGTESNKITIKECTLR